MSNQRIKVPRLPDRSIAECFKLLGNQYKVQSANVAGLGFANIGTIDFNDDTNEEWNALLELDSTLINTMTFNLGGLSVTYYRGGQYPPEQQSAIYDEILLSWNQQNATITNKDKLNIVSTINSQLKAFEPGRFVGQGISEEQNQLISIQ